MPRSSRIVVPIAYLLLTLALTYPLALYLGSAIPGDGFDGWQNYWNLWWEGKALLDLGVSPLFCPLMDYPAGAGLLFHTLNLFNVWSLPVQLLAGLPAAYNAVVLFSFAASGLGACLLARWLTRGRAGSEWAGWIAGLIFTFAPFHFAHLLGHMQVISLEWLPFAVLFLCKVVDRARPGHAALAGLFIAFAALCDWYQLLYLLLFAGLLVLYRIATRRFSRQSFAALMGSGAVAGLLLLPYLGPMVVETTRARYMQPEAGDAWKYSADLLAFFLPNEMHPIWGAPIAAHANGWTLNIAERMVSVGYIPLALAALAVWATVTRRAARSVAGSGERARGNRAGVPPGAGFWALASAGFALLALGPELHVNGRATGLALPYAWLVEWVPFMSMSRSVSRFAGPAMLCLAACAAFGVTRVISGPGRRKGAIVGLCLTVLVCFEFLPAPYRLSWPDTPGFYRTLASDPRPYAILPVPIEKDHSQYLLYQTAHGKALTSAYTSRGNPRTWMDRAPLLQQLRWPGREHVIAADPTRAGPAVLQAAGVRFVVIDRARLGAEGLRAEAVSLMARVFGGMPPTLDDGRLMVYDAWEPRFISLLPKSAPFPRLGDGWSGEWRGHDGEMACWLEGRGEIPLHSPVPTEARLNLRFFNGARSDRSLKISEGNRELARRDLRRYEYCDLELPLSLSAGVRTVVVEGNGPSIELRRVALSAGRR